jgi:hypothetical protein
MMNESGSNIIESVTDFDNESSIFAAADAVSAELVMGNNEGGFHNDDIISSDNSDDDDVIKAIIKGGKKGGVNDDNDTDEISDGANDTSGTYPADCYSFLALYSPLDHFGFW